MKQTDKRRWTSWPARKIHQRTRSWHRWHHTCRSYVCSWVHTILTEHSAIQNNHQHHYPHDNNSHCPAASATRKRTNNANPESVKDETESEKNTSCSLQCYNMNKNTHTSTTVTILLKLASLTGNDGALFGADDPMSGASWFCNGGGRLLSICC